MSNLTKKLNEEEAKEYINKKLSLRYTEKEILENNLYLEAEGFQAAMFKIQDLKNKIEA